VLVGSVNKTPTVSRSRTSRLTGNEHVRRRAPATPAPGQTANPFFTGGGSLRIAVKVGLWWLFTRLANRIGWLFIFLFECVHLEVQPSFRDATAELSGLRCILLLYCQRYDFNYSYLLR